MLVPGLVMVTVCGRGSAPPNGLTNDNDGTGEKVGVAAGNRLINRMKTIAVNTNRRRFNIGFSTFCDTCVRYAAVSLFTCKSNRLYPFVVPIKRRLPVDLHLAPGVAGCVGLKHTA
jgi:hypothetical protein